MPLGHPPAVETTSHSRGFTLRDRQSSARETSACPFSCQRRSTTEATPRCLAPVRLPHLTPHERKRVESANILAKFAIDLFVLAVSLSCVFSLENPSNSWMWNVLLHMCNNYMTQALLQAWVNMSAVQFSNCAHGVNVPNKPHGGAHMMCMTTSPSHAQVTTCTSPTRSPNPLGPGPLIPQPKVSIHGCLCTRLCQALHKKFAQSFNFSPPKSLY